MKWEFAVIEPWMWSEQLVDPADGCVLVYGLATDTPIGLKFHGAVPVQKELIEDDLMGFIDSARGVLEEAYVLEEKALKFPRRRIPDVGLPDAEDDIRAPHRGAWQL